MLAFARKILNKSFKINPVMKFKSKFCSNFSFSWRAANSLVQLCLVTVLLVFLSFSTYSLCFLLQYSPCWSSSSSFSSASSSIVYHLLILLILFLLTLVSRLWPAAHIIPFGFHLLSRLSLSRSLLLPFSLIHLLLLLILRILLPLPLDHNPPPPPPPAFRRYGLTKAFHEKSDGF